MASSAAAAGGVAVTSGWVMGCLTCGEVAPFGGRKPYIVKCPTCGNLLVAADLDDVGTKIVWGKNSKIGYNIFSKRSVRSKKFLAELAEIQAKGASP